MLILIALRHLATLQYEIWDVYNMWYIYLRHRTHAIRECIMFTFMCYRSILMKYIIVMWAKHISFFCQQNAVGKKQESRKDKCHIQMLLFRSSMMKDGNKSVLIPKKNCLQQNLKIKSQMSKTWKSILAKRSNLKVLRLWKYLGLEIKSQQKRGRDKSGRWSNF